MKVLLTANTAWYIHNFRAGLIDALGKEGYQVHAAAPEDPYVSRLLEKGVVFHKLPMDSQSTRPTKDFLLFFRLLSLYRRIHPDAVLHFTIKPNIYGTAAAGLLGIPAINNITGLGSIFLKNTFLALIVKVLYRVSFSFANRTFFQNSDDLELFLRNGIVRPDKVSILPGSGINTKLFYPMKKSQGDGSITFLLIARMIWEKGIREYVAAAKRVKALHSNTCFQMIGESGVNNPSAIPQARIHDWEQKGYIKYLGFTDDIRSVIKEADCVVLPSYYREGVPRTLLEAASMAKPIITTDSVGCREVVDDSENGFIVPIKDTASLSRAMIRFIELAESARKEMGARSREKVMRHFDERTVIQRYLKALQQAVVQVTA